ncbi:MAG TPA: hypothetical protein VKY45_05425 [Marinilabiliaceae bacterium]|nr:hypothetical protein [Marinilabiliaceae bacterium]
MSAQEVIIRPTSAAALGRSSINPTPIVTLAFGYDFLIGLREDFEILTRSGYVELSDSAA